MNPGETALALPPCQIIRLKPEDYARCANIWDMARQPDKTQQWYDELVSGKRLILVCTIADEFIAEGALVFDTGDPDYTIAGQRIYLSRLIVKQEYRRRGIGGALVEHLCAHAKSLGYTEISVGVNCDNHAARRLYAQKGFATVLYEGADEYGHYVKLLKGL